jgi:hypothetical protein
MEADSVCDSNAYPLLRMLKGSDKISIKRMLQSLYGRDANLIEEQVPQWLCGFLGFDQD